MEKAKRLTLVASAVSILLRVSVCCRGREAQVRNGTAVPGAVQAPDATVAPEQAATVAPVRAAIVAPEQGGCSQLVQVHGSG